LPAAIFQIDWHAASMFGFAGARIFPGRAAVQIFCKISGFLMAMILHQKYADTRQKYADTRQLDLLLQQNRQDLRSLSRHTCGNGGGLPCLRTVTGNAILLNAWFAEAVSMDVSTSAFRALRLRVADTAGASGRNFARALDPRRALTNPAFPVLAVLASCCCPCAS
jgi:hypothetical protein